MPRTRVLRYFVVACCVAVGVIGLRTTLAPAPREAARVPYSETLYSESEWLSFARNWAHKDGLRGSPTREQWALMTHGSYLTLINDNYNDPAVGRETPVFVYQVFGRIPELKWLGSAGGSRDIVGFTFVFNATTAMPMHATAHTKSAQVRGDTSLNLSFIPEDRGAFRDVPPLPTLAVLDAASEEEVPGGLRR